jgi:hypothetical protein
VHDIIPFSNSELERTLWRVLQSRAFQRLRRVKQLGFSDLVYPGACHSRFAHSVGVFHTARMLMTIVHQYISNSSDTKESRALTAALVHDVGHGPFSHAFEKVGKRLNLKLANHEEMSDALVRDGEIGEILNSTLGSGFAGDVADILKKDGVKSVEHAVVSSQFDADRLDYIRRDRLMTGTQHAAIDFPWLLDNLEIGALPEGVDDEPVGIIETFVLGPKAIYAAEAFVLGLFQLYPTIYFHKATRGAELIFVELLVRLVKLVQDGSRKATGLPDAHPLVRFARKPENLDVALTLDDTVVWGALSQMAEARDELVSEMSRRLRDRSLYKCRDIRIEVQKALDPDGTDTDAAVLSIDRCCTEIKQKLTEWISEKEERSSDILLDEASRSPYKPLSESKGPLDRINIRTESNQLVDLREKSPAVKALKPFKLLRAYSRSLDSTEGESLTTIVQGEIRKCLTTAP